MSDRFLTEFHTVFTSAVDRFARKPAKRRILEEFSRRWQELKPKAEYGMLTREDHAEYASLYADFKRFAEENKLITEPPDYIAPAFRDAMNGTRSAHPTAVTSMLPSLEPVEASTSPTKQADAISGLSLAVGNAYASFVAAERKAGRKLKDHEAYKLLKDDGMPDELDDYILPTFATWQRNLRRARNSLGEQKHTRRARRATGKSVANGDQV
jgi:hypothetical protein